MAHFRGQRVLGNCIIKRLSSLPRFPHFVPPQSFNFSAPQFLNPSIHPFPNSVNSPIHPFTHRPSNIDHRPSPIARRPWSIAHRPSTIQFNSIHHFLNKCYNLLQNPFRRIDHGTSPIAHRPLNSTQSIRQPRRNFHKSKYFNVSSIRKLFNHCIFPRDRKYY